MAMLSRFLSRLREGTRRARQALRDLTEVEQDVETILKIVAFGTLAVLFIWAHVDPQAVGASIAQGWQIGLQMLHQALPQLFP